MTDGSPSGPITTGPLAAEGRARALCPPVKGDIQHAFLSCACQKQAMAKYEIWGSDDTGKPVTLAFVTGDVPEIGDTILVRGQVRPIERVWRHHMGPQAIQRVGVGQVLECSS